MKFNTMIVVACLILCFIIKLRFPQNCPIKKIILLKKNPAKIQLKSVKILLWWKNLVRSFEWVKSPSTLYYKLCIDSGTANSTWPDVAAIEVNDLSNFRNAFCLLEHWNDNITWRLLGQNHFCTAWNPLWHQKGSRRSQGLSPEIWSKGI